MLTQRRTLRRLLEKKFGTLNPPVVARIEALTSEQLDDAIVAVLDAHALADLGLSENE